MTPRAIWSVEAERDLEEIAIYVALLDFRPATAERIVRDAHTLANLIATQPEMGQSRSEFGERCRVMSMENRWIILYRPAEHGIDVLRFVDGTRDYHRLF